jgi:hypothetical protein
MNDQSNLIIDTRKINKWVQENNFKIRVLVLHHPISWLNEWSQSELSNMRAFASLRKEARISFSGEKNRMQLMRLAGMALAKHEFGVKHPNDKLVEKATKSLEGSEENVNAAQTESLT